MHVPSYVRASPLSHASLQEPIVPVQVSSSLESWLAGFFSQVPPTQQSPEEESETETLPFPCLQNSLDLQNIPLNSEQVGRFLLQQTAPAEQE